MKTDYIVDIDTERIDILLARLSGVTRTLITEHIDLGFVYSEGKVVKKSAKMEIGKVVTVDLQEEKMPNLEPKDIPFEILADNDNYAIICKPPYLTVHPAPGNFDHTLVNALLYKFNIEHDNEDCRPGIVHRLDKDTSGIMIITKNYDAKLKFSEMFAKREVKKIYQAVLHGKLKEDNVTVDKAIARDKANRKRMAINEKGKNSVSIFKIKERYRESTLVEVQILTGRTHQIRVHAKFLRHPLVGDTLYGGRELHGMDRQALHACSLELVDPYTNKEVYVNSKLPDDMVKLMEKLSNT